MTKTPRLLRQTGLLCFCSLFLLFCLPCKSQNERVQFENISKGLSQPTVTSIVQDKYGFLWMGTYYGLNVFDGVEFTTFESSKDDTFSLNNNFIFSLLAGNDGKIWVGTYGGGLNVFDIDENKFRRVTCSNKAQVCRDNYVTALFQDQNNLIWIGTEKGGLFVYDPEKDTYDQYYPANAEKDQKRLTYISTICDDQYGNIWIGTFGEGLSMIEKSNGTLKTFPQSEPGMSIPGNTIRSMHKGKTGRLWMGTNNGIEEVFLDKNGEITLSRDFMTPCYELDKLESSVVLSILEKDNFLWAGTENNGLYRVNLLTGDITLFTHNPLEERSISGNSIWSLFEDRDGILWIGTFLKGISAVNPMEQKFFHTRHVPMEGKSYTFDLVSSFEEDENGNLWIGSDGGGLVFYDKKKDRYSAFNKNSPNSPLSSNEVVSVLYDTKQNLWVGTWNGGVNLLRKGASEFEFLPGDSNSKNGLTSNDIYEIFEDSKGRIWIASFRQGIDVYVPDKHLYYHFNKTDQSRKILSNKVRTIVEDAKGNIWIGTEESGVQKITVNDDLEITDSKSFFSIKDPDATEGVSINTLFLDAKEQIWVGTTGNGLFRIDPKNDTFVNFSKKEGLPSNMILVVLEDTLGNIWGSTNVGLFRLNPTTDEIKAYSSADGVQSGGFNKSSALLTKDGYLYFGGMNGFTFFNQLETPKNTKPPQIYITNFKVSNQTYLPKKGNQPKIVLNDLDVSLKHNQNDLTFEFKAISYINASKNKYLFKLENYDDHWREGGTDREVHYTNVPPGSYTFMVKVANNDGVWTTKNAEVFIQIKKPWYLTFLAYFVYASIIFLLMFWTRNNIISRERLQGELKLEQIRRGKMEEVNQIRTQFFANISHEFKTPLTLIMSPLQSLLYKRKSPLEEEKIFGIMMRNVKQLHKLISQIMELSKVESGVMKLKVSPTDIGVFLEQLALNFTNFAEKKHITFELDIPKEEVILFLEKDKMEKVLINVLSNAFKFTPSYGKVRVKMTESADFVVITISDTGKGVSPEEKELIFERYYTSPDKMISGGTGIGLSLSKQFVEMHKGSIIVTSDQEYNTVFKITLNKGSAHFNQEEIADLEAPIKYSSESLATLRALYEDVDRTGGKHTAKEEKKETVILVVEDNEDLLSFLDAVLSVKYKVLLARNGEEGLEIAQEQIPDVIVSDIVMPKMDGLELSKRLKENVLTSHIFVILLSARTTEENKEEGLSLGVDSYMTKPFNPRLLEMHVQNLLETRSKFKQQLLSKKSIYIDHQSESYTKLDKQFLGDLVEVVEQNMSNPNLKIDDLCRSLGISNSQLYRKLKGLFDQSPIEFIRMVRLKHAAQLLEGSNLRIAEITYKVGFIDLQYFRKTFRKQYGMSPSEFREHVQFNGNSQLN